MKTVFVSASVPDPKRDRKYFETADMVAIRDAITATIEVVTPRDRLIFGGQPAITPMVARVAAELGTLGNVTIYQSDWFEPFFPPENKAFESLEKVPAGIDQAASLKKMREVMLANEFDAAVFIGGMDGVEKEFDHLHKRRISCYPLATTGGAARILAFEHRRELLDRGLHELFVSYDYLVLLRRLLRPESLPQQEMLNG
jgi:SLOG cluster3 family